MTASTQFSPELRRGKKAPSSKNSSKMRNSGFVSIGHILSGKRPELYRETMRHFCTVIFCNLDEERIHNKSEGFYRFDTFFKSVPVSVESFAKFFGGILRRHETNEFGLQLAIEKLAWDMVKFDFDAHTCEMVSRRDLYRLFCLFNRFCDFTQIPLTLPELSLCFLLKELRLPLLDSCKKIYKNAKTAAAKSDNDNKAWKFSDLVTYICDNKDSFDPKAIKRCYDVYVRDVVREGRVRFRLLGSSGSKSSKIVSITSREMLIYEDDNNLDQPALEEPSGRVLHRVPLVDATTKVCKSMFAKNKIFLQVVSPSREAPDVELCFDSSRDHYDLFAWNQSIQEATYSTRANSNRLSKSHLRLGMVDSSVTEERRLSAQNSPKPDGLLSERMRAKSQLDLKLSDQDPDSVSSISSGSSCGSSTCGGSKEDLRKKVLTTLSKPTLTLPRNNRKGEFSFVHQQLKEDMDAKEQNKETWKQTGSFVRTC